jgi:hypothetical protein
MRFRSDNGPNLTMAFTAPLWTNGASLSATLRQITAKVTTTMRKRPSRLSNSWLRKSPHPETGHGGVQAGTPGIPKSPPLENGLSPTQMVFGHQRRSFVPAPVRHTPRKSRATMERARALTTRAPPHTPILRPSIEMRPRTETQHSVCCSSLHSNMKPLAAMLNKLNMKCLSQKQIRK